MVVPLSSYGTIETLISYEWYKSFFTL